jgi:hypothetical protein
MGHEIVDKAPTLTFLASLPTTMASSTSKSSSCGGKKGKGRRGGGIKDAYNAAGKRRARGQRGRKFVRTLIMLGRRMSLPGSVMALANLEKTTGSVGTGRF